MMTQTMMAANRWKSLDFEPRRTEPQDGEKRGREDGRPGDLTRTSARPAELAGEASRLAWDPWAGPVTGIVAQARSAYLLRNYQAAVDLLEPQLSEKPALPGGQRLLGQALARVMRRPEAVEHLREAVRQDAADWLARASLSSLLLRDDRALSPPGWIEAVTHLEDILRNRPLPAVRELLGGAQWWGGQAALVVARFREAVERFEAAAHHFSAAAAESRVARAPLPVRHPAALVGQAVALLSAGKTEAAQRLFSRQPATSRASAEPLNRFAAHLYEFCEALVLLPEAERSGAAAELREVVAAVRLEVGFYDGRQAVSLAWVSGAG
jgi:tetratricopeptide (TPR) repeat protein